MRKLSAFLLIALAAVTVLLSAAAQSAYAAPGGTTVPGVGYVDEEEIPDGTTTDSKLADDLRAPIEPIITPESSSLTSQSSGINMINPPDGATNVPAGPITIRWSGGNGTYRYSFTGSSEYGQSSSSGSISIVGANPSPSIEENLAPGTTYKLTIQSGISYGIFHFTTVDPIKVSGISMTEKELTITEGEKSYLGYTISPSDAYNTKVTWKSSNTGVARVDSRGEVTAVAPGNAVITATTRDGGYTDTCSVTVQKAVVKVSGISLTTNQLNMTEGEKGKLSYNITPSNATDETVNWKSSNSGVAAVDSSGNVTAVAPGTATITVTTKDGGYSANATVTVKEKTVKVTGISLTTKQLNMTEGEKGKLSYNITPSNATDKTVNWKSSNSGVAAVDSSGNVTAVAPGTATITVTTVDGGHTDVCSVTVEKAVVAVSGISLAEKELNIVEGENSELRYTITPSDATDRSVSWKSSDSGIVSVNTSGVVTAAAPGTATITVTTRDGGYTDTCSVTVEKAVVNVTGITLDKSTANLVKGQSEDITATVLPNDATNKKVKWSSSNTKVATVSGTGIVVATGAGTSTITAMTEDGGFTAEVKVTVSKITPSIDALPKASAITEGSLLSASTLTGGRAIDPATGATIKGTFEWQNPTLLPELADSKSSFFGVIFRPDDTANYESANGLVQIEVKAAVVPAEGVKLDKSAYDIFVGKTLQATATVSPADATNKKVFWGSSNSKIVTIDASGKMTAVAAGEAVITATTADGDFSDKAEVHVKKHPTTITLKPTASAISEGGALKESALSGGTATSGGVPVPGIFVWSNPQMIPLISDSLKTEYDVDFVPSDKSTYEENSTKVKVEVKQKIYPVSGITISQRTLELKIGETGTLNAAVAPENATNKAVTWASSNINAATVDGSGNVTAVAEGSSVISVTTDDGGFSDSCTVTVSPANVPVSGINIENSKLTLRPNESIAIVVNVLPDNATNKAVTWKSADENIATVDANGNVTAVAQGQTVVSAVTDEGGFTAECIVSVTGEGGGGGGCDTGAGILLLTFTIPFIYRRKR
ncbi:Ig-like domain-containing protein [Synergistes jonesii]|uniref:Ig-like domain-containing protein n=1 Tax=Synergistes jonesii TaxID=2754 RepID=UPI000872F9EE|nr:Ig-like domain-containing protein [Synergistes jonesii]